MVAISSQKQAVINFPHKEVTCISKIIKNYKNSPVKTKEMKTEIFNIFVPKMQERAEVVAAEKKISAMDYLHDLYLAFWEQFDSIVQEKKSVVYHLCKMLNQTLPAGYIPVEYRQNTSHKLTRDEFNKLSYRIDEQSPAEKKEIIINTIESVLSKKQKIVLEKFMQGGNWIEIAKDTNQSSSGVSNAYYRIIDRLNCPDIKDKLKRIYCESDTTKDLNINKDGVLSDTKIKKQPEFNPEKIRQIVEKNRSPLNITAELEDIMITQTRYSSVFTNPSLTARVKNFLKKDPSFRFKIELPERCNNDEFKREVERVSVETFGINIFEFI